MCELRIRTTLHLILSEGLWIVEGWEPQGEQERCCFIWNGFLPHSVSSKGPSLICLTWPCVPPVTCSTAYLVRLMTPGAACHSAFTVTSFISSLDVPASEACPISFSLASFKFFFPLFLWETQESFFWLPLMELGWEENLIVYER